MKKILLLFFITVIFLGAYFSFFISDEKDACLDSGVCKAGLSLKMNDGKEITISKHTCIQYNGQWREKYSDCLFY